MSQANTRIANFKKYEGVLPYASELFGVYQPLLGWKSLKKSVRNRQAFQDVKTKFISELLEKYKDNANVRFNEDGTLTSEGSTLKSGYIEKDGLNVQGDSKLLSIISTILKEKGRPVDEEWKGILAKDVLDHFLFNVNSNMETVFDYYKKLNDDGAAAIRKENALQTITHQPTSAEIEANQNKITALITQLNQSILQSLKRESVIASVISDLAINEKYSLLDQLFYATSGKQLLNDINNLNAVLENDFDDPYLLFDPNKDAGNVSVSPIGIVHLYRQFFFELDTFLGTPVSHVWVSPGSTVELIETHSIKTTVEKSYETAYESNTKNESKSSNEFDFSDTLKEDNKSNDKAAFSTTISESYPIVSISASASLNMETTQQRSNESIQKAKREQSSMVSTEIKQNYKTTFRTIIETTDTSSKRYVISNPSTDKLQNYELRRKMRQVGVQMQDVGSYLCWETFVDEPGKNLGLGNLVHIAKPADLLPPSDTTEVPMPDLITNFNFKESVNWSGKDKSIPWEKETRIIWGEVRGINPPQGYEVDKNLIYDEKNRSKTIYYAFGSDQDMIQWDFRYKILDQKTFQIGIHVEDSYSDFQFNGFEYFQNKGFNVGEPHQFKVSGSIRLVLSTNKIKEINDINAKKKTDGIAADLENQRRTHESYIKAAKERIDLASNIQSRPFEDLREEERSTIYRALIKDLVQDAYTTSNSEKSFTTMHVLSELLNSIFDIDKMLYFVAPEWWKPRKGYHQQILPNKNSNKFQSAISGNSAMSVPLVKPISPNIVMSKPLGASYLPEEFKGNVTNWGGQDDRENNYFITENSKPAKLGSSLGWILQLDGDNRRNQFLNAPWVKAVLPIRPGMEEAAMHWLQQVNVEGTEGLNGEYMRKQEHASIIEQLKNTDRPANNPPTVYDAIRVMCKLVKEKNEESLKVSKFPKDPAVNIENRIDSTPTEKVYEHGFYPLEGGFKAVTTENFEIISQWVEVLPTDQIVPVPVEYDPITGRLKQS